MTKGTPKTIHEAIVTEMCCGPASDFADRMEQAFVDYLSQKFTTAIFKAQIAGDESLAAVIEANLSELWENITGKAMK